MFEVQQKRKGDSAFLGSVPVRKMGYGQELGVAAAKQNRQDSFGQVVKADARGLQAALGEAQLLQRIAKQDRAAFAEIMQRHLAMCVTVARRVLNNEADAEDVAQEAMLKLWQVSGRLEIGEKGVRPWLARVTYNAAIDRLRMRRPVDPLDEAPEIPELPQQLEVLEAQDTTKRVESALAKLPERQRVALVLFHYEGFTQVEVAETMHSSVEAVESLLSRARRSLRKELAEDWQKLLKDHEPE